MNVNKIVRNVSMVVIFTLIIVSFAFWGMSKNMITGVQSTVVLAAGDHVVDKADFKRDFEQQRQDLEQQNKQQITTEELAANGVDTALLARMKLETSMSVVLDRLGVRPSLDMIADQMRKVQAFFDPISGRFDRTAYLKVLADNNLTDDKFKNMERDEIAQKHLDSAVQAGLRPPLAITAAQALLAHQDRDLSVLFITPSMVPAIPAPTDAQLTTFLTQNAQPIPESRALTVVRFETKDVLPSVSVTDQDIQKIVDFRKDQQTTPETRSVVQISAKDRATAQAVSTRLSKGEDPDTVAKSVGSTAQHLENKPKTAILDAKTADAAFSLPAGQTSAPIEGALGFTVVKVLNVTPGKQADMTAIRKAAETEAKERAAQAKISAAADKFEDALTAGTDLVEAAKAANAHVYTTDPIFSSGADKDGKKPDGVTPRVIQEVSQLQANGVSDIVQESPGEYFVVRIDKIVPSAMPKLADIRDKLIPAWNAQQASTAMKTKSDELATKLRQGGTLADIAKQVGGSVSHVTGISLATGEAMAKQYGDELIRGAVQAKKGDVYTGAAPPAAGAPPTAVRAFVASLDDIHQADIATVAPEAQKSAPQVAQSLASEMEEQVFNAAGKLVTVKTYPDRAKEAIGLEAAPAPAAAAAKAPATGGAAKK